MLLNSNLPLASSERLGCFNIKMVCLLLTVLRIRIRDPLHIYPKDPDPGSGSGMIFFRISDRYHVLNSIYLQDFTFINGEKQEKLNLVSNMTSIPA
jgi:hypothetical protein